MALDLDRLSVLIVDDSPFIRELIANALLVLGIGRITKKDHGGSAISFLREVRSNPMRAGVMSVDIIISNWDMSPVDGPLLLRWVRRHKESPNRYVPFLMLTAYTEAERVAAARDLGAHEVISKPFTIRALGDKIVGVIRTNRQFVQNSSYFGPDRRRHAEPHSGPERRKLTDKSVGVEIVHVG